MLTNQHAGTIKIVMHERKAQGDLPLICIKPIFVEGYIIPRAYSYYSSPSSQNEVIWTSGISCVGHVPQVFDCKEVVSWCTREIYFKPNNYSTVGPLSCFFVTSGLPQDVEIVGANIDLQRRRLQGVPKKA
jgi:hypothetical protein